MDDVLMTCLDENGKWCCISGKPHVRWLASRGEFDGIGKTKDEALKNLEEAMNHGTAADDHHQDDAHRV